jgi:hypothetical protein
MPHIKLPTPHGCSLTGSTNNRYSTLPTACTLLSCASHMPHIKLSTPHDYFLIRCTNRCNTFTTDVIRLTRLGLSNLRHGSEVNVMCGHVVQMHGSSHNARGWLTMSLAYVTSRDYATAICP